MVKALLDYSAAIDATEHESGNAVHAEMSLTQALRNLQTAINEAGVQISHSALPTVRASDVHVTALFQNLIGNSVKYRRKDGPAHISISAKPKWRRVDL